MLGSRSHACPAYYDPRMCDCGNEVKTCVAGPRLPAQLALRGGRKRGAVIPLMREESDQHGRIGVCLIHGSRGLGVRKSSQMNAFPNDAFSWSGSPNIWYITTISIGQNPHHVAGYSRPCSDALSKVSRLQYGTTSPKSASILHKSFHQMIAASNGKG